MATTKITLTPIQPKSPAHAAAIQSAQAKINAALVNGNTGPKGFLQWVKAAWPKPIADKILAAAKAHQEKVAAAAASGPIAQASNVAKIGSYMGPTTFGGVGSAPRMGALSPRPTRGSRALTWAGRNRRAGMGAYHDPAAVLAGFGQTTDLSSGIGASSVTTPITIDTTGDNTIANSSTSSASPSWLSDIGSAVTAATQAYLGIQQSKDAQTLFDTNLQRAQQGLAPLNANPSAYGIVNPQVNVGLSSSTTTLLMWGGIGLGVILLLNVGLKAAKRG